MSALGIAGGGLLAIASPWLVDRLGQVPPELLPEMLGALWILAAAVPVAISGAGLSGVLEAAHRFDLVNAVRGPLGAASYVAPLLVSLVWPNLVAIAIALWASRVAITLAYLFLCLRVVPELRECYVLESSVLPKVLGVGGWLTVSNVISPLMVSMDRFFIAAMISAAAVGYYATAQEAVTRMTFIPVALTSALFPSFASNTAGREKFNVHLFGRALDYMFLAALPFSMALIGLANEGLSLWLGLTFAESAAPPLQILACGMFANSLARVPLTYLQAAGRPDLTAKAHLAELPLYVLVLVSLTTLYGINGVAIAWTVRAVIDAVVLFFLSLCVSPALGPSIVRILKLTALSCMAFGLLLAPFPPAIRWLLLASLLASFCHLSWNSLMTPDEQQAVKRLATGWRHGTTPCPEIPRGDL